MNRKIKNYCLERPWSVPALARAERATAIAVIPDFPLFHTEWKVPICFARVFHWQVIGLDIPASFAIIMFTIDGKLVCFLFEVCVSGLLCVWRKLEK